MSPFRKVYSIIGSFGCSQNRGSRGPCLADVRFNRHTWPGQGPKSSIKTSMFSFHISFPTMCATHLAKIITEETFLNLLNQKSAKSCWFQPPSYSETICNNQELSGLTKLPLSLAKSRLPYHPSWPKTRRPSALVQRPQTFATGRPGWPSYPMVN